MSIKVHWDHIIATCSAAIESVAKHTLSEGCSLKSEGCSLNRMSDNSMPTCGLAKKPASQYAKKNRPKAETHVRAGSQIICLIQYQRHVFEDTTRTSQYDSSISHALAKIQQVSLHTTERRSERLAQPAKQLNSSSTAQPASGRPATCKAEVGHMKPPKWLDLVPASPGSSFPTPQLRATHVLGTRKAPVPAFGTPIPRYENQARAFRLGEYSAPGPDANRTPTEKPLTKLEEDVGETGPMFKTMPRHWWQITRS